MMQWTGGSRELAREEWLGWYRSAIRCRLEPVKRVARMIKRHLDGIVTAMVQGVSNARAESINAGVQKLKYMARGFRNRERFRNAIYRPPGACWVGGRTRTAGRPSQDKPARSEPHSTAAIPLKSQF